MSIPPVFPLAELPLTAALVPPGSVFAYTPGSDPNVTSAEVDAAAAAAILEVMEGDAEELVL